MIEISPEAAAQIKSICDNDEQGRSFRIFLRHKGCDGFQFGFGLDHPIVQDSCIIEGDVCVLVSTRLARLIRGSTLVLADEPVPEKPASGCTPPPQVDIDERFVLFDLQLADEKRYRGKFYKHAQEASLSWDVL